MIQNPRLEPRLYEETILTGCISDLRVCARSLDRTTTGTNTKKVISKEPSIFPPSFITKKNHPVKGKTNQKNPTSPERSLKVEYFQQELL